MGGSIYGHYIGDLKCWPFSKSQRMHGVWVGEFETSVLFPNATTFHEIEKSKAQIWVDTDLKVMPALLSHMPDGNTHAYLVEAEGRLSLCDAWFGHQGQYPRDFVMTRIYSLRELPVSR